MIIDLPGEPITAELTDEGGEEMEMMEQEEAEAAAPAAPESGSESEWNRKMRLPNSKTGLSCDVLTIPFR